MRERQSDLARGRERDGEGASNEGAVADKWQLLRALTEGRDRLGLSDRTICVLEALLSFHPGKALDGAAPVIVFPSNRELSLRTRGMAPATLRRHLAALVEAGLILRRDSANGKRYCRRDGEGAPDEAFGFDVAPFALEAPAIFEAADRARAEARAVAKLRAEITIHARDVRKIIEAAVHEGRAGGWAAFLAALLDLDGPLPRRAARGPLEDRRSALARLHADVERAYLGSLSEEEMSANDVDDERHIQNSNADPHFEKNGRRHNAGKTAEAEQPKGEAGKGGRQLAAPRDEAGSSASVPRNLERKSLAIPLEEVLRVCPQIADYARSGVRSWPDLIATAGLVRSFLGISPDAWTKARAAMGDAAASVTIAAMLERSEAIRSPGGYLRALTEKAERGQFSIKPMLDALRE